MSIKPILFENGILKMIDQRLLPTEELWLEYTDYRRVAEAIRSMVVRGAPAIGVAAAFGAAFGAREIAAEDFDAFWPRFEEVCAVLAATRPTAVNLFWALDRMKACARANRELPLPRLKERLLDEAVAIAEEDERINRAMGKNGEVLIPQEARVLTHCNAGALATAGYGTALGVIRAAHEAGKKIRVFADETRPWLQGARLTCWELMKEEIPVTLISDNMAGFFMSKGEISCCVVGADRIAANGDTANKIGTYSVAVLAKENNIPFYVAAPISTLDLSLKSGAEIPIEERHSREVTHLQGFPLAPEGVRVRNPAFDVTPARYITAIITEKGAVTGDYQKKLRELVKR
ncbi:MAG TPA: S-methyl-5-thioribose-1-phosphate isomerase [Deferrimonas sp.]